MDDYIDMEGSNTAVERKTCSQQLDLPSATNSPINNHKIVSSGHLQKWFSYYFLFPASGYKQSRM